ncbi:MAG: DUF5615 family PIN-like protein [bacterium]|nr:DUF5615 family PIN-like protein [bacterium]
MFKFLADENIAPRVVDALRKEKFDVLSIYEEKLSGASDASILKLAQKEKRIILTHDKDFGNLIRQPHLPHSGVILLRLRDQSPQNVIIHLAPFLKEIKLNKIKNRLVVLQEGKIRII